MSMTSTADSVLRAIGGTPVVHLRRVVPAGGADVLIKLESVNPTGSYKDRMALAMIEGAEARGVLRPGMRVVEFTGGSTGSSLAMVCAAKGYRFVVLSSDAFSRNHSSNCAKLLSRDEPKRIGGVNPERRPRAP